MAGILITERVLQLTEDGSHTVAIPSMNITYHSRHGAIQESRHVYIEAGLRYYSDKNISPGTTINILEIGFGTGLNVILSIQQALLQQQKIFYETIEPFPLAADEVQQLNYTSFIPPALLESYYALHRCSWYKPVELLPCFSFLKTKNSVEDFSTATSFHVIYFDAFHPAAQPELWTEAIFRKIYSLLQKHGIVVTYCSKGSVQRAMKAAGFSIEKLKGPPGKREIIRATRLL